MELTIIGCGYVGQALARRLQPRRPQLGLTLTTTRQERQGALSPLADEVMVCDATDPEQLLKSLQNSPPQCFALVQKESTGG